MFYIIICALVHVQIYLRRIFFSFLVNCREKSISGCEGGIIVKKTFKRINNSAHFFSDDGICGL